MIPRTLESKSTVPMTRLAGPGSKKCSGSLPLIRLVSGSFQHPLPEDQSERYFGSHRTRTGWGSESCCCLGALKVVVAHTVGRAKWICERNRQLHECPPAVRAVPPVTVPSIIVAVAGIDIVNVNTARPIPLLHRDLLFLVAPASKCLKVINRRSHSQWRQRHERELLHSPSDSLLARSRDCWNL